MTAIALLSFLLSRHAIPPAPLELPRPSVVELDKSDPFGRFRRRHG